MVLLGDASLLFLLFLVRSLQGEGRILCCNGKCYVFFLKCFWLFKKIRKYLQWNYNLRHFKIEKMHFESPFLKLFDGCKREDSKDMAFRRRNNLCTTDSSLDLPIPSDFHHLIFSVAPIYFIYSIKINSTARACDFIWTRTAEETQTVLVIIPVIMYKDTFDRKPRNHKFQFQLSS